MGLIDTDIRNHSTTLLHSTGRRAATCKAARVTVLGDLERLKTGA